MAIQFIPKYSLIVKMVISQNKNDPFHDGNFDLNDHKKGVLWNSRYIILNVFLDASIYKHIIAKWAGAVGFALWYIVSWKNIKCIGLIDKK